MKKLHEKGLIKSPDRIAIEDLRLENIFFGSAFLLLNFLFLLIFWTSIVLFIYRTYLAIRNKLMFDYFEVLSIGIILYAHVIMILGAYQNRFSSNFYIFVVILTVLNFDFLCQQLKWNKKYSNRMVGM